MSRRAHRRALRRRYGRAAERMYRVLWVRDDRKTSGVLFPGPLTHKEAMTVISKTTPYNWRRLMLEEIR